MTPQTVNGLWIGETLSKMELLTLHSFVSQGHTFQLWVYNQLENTVPQGVVLKDANEIIPKDQVFSYQYRNQFGHGKGSFSGFSDIFRYKLLYEHGGWWTDMDVTCLQPLPQVEQYFFRPHHSFLVVGNLMHCPAKSELMHNCYLQALNQVNAQSTDWHKPIEILNQEVERLGLQRYVQGEISNRDWLSDVLPFFFSKRTIPEHWLVIHWTNENFRSKNWDKNNFKYASTYGELLLKHQLIAEAESWWSRWKHDFRYNLSMAKALKR